MGAAGVIMRGLALPVLFPLFPFLRVVRLLPLPIVPLFLVGCSSPDPGALETHRASLGPGGSVVSGTAGSSDTSAASSGASSGSSSGASSGGSTSSGSTEDAGDGGGGESSTDLLQHCVDDINSYRATINVPAYTRASDLETFAAAGAESDSQTGEAHGHFIATNGGNGVAFAENEIPGWPLAQYGSLTAIMDQGMQMMWAEGPGGGHYDNMASTQYTLAGCGIYTTSDGSVWITTDFR
jgi:uncharacterized protein YkwD